MGNFDLHARWGGDRILRIGDRELNIAEAIELAGPGKGAAVLPWCLFRYGRAMRLRPEEVYILALLLSRAWTGDGIAVVSVRKLALMVQASRPTLLKALRHIEELGYIVRIDPKPRTVLRFDVRPAYAALALLAAYDPTTAFELAAGWRPDPFSVYMAWFSLGLQKSPDLACLDKLAARARRGRPRRTQEEDAPESFLEAMVLDL